MQVVDLSANELLVQHLSAKMALELRRHHSVPTLIFLMDDPFTEKPIRWMHTRRVRTQIIRRKPLHVCVLRFYVDDGFGVLNDRPKPKTDTKQSVMLDTTIG